VRVAHAWRCPCNCRYLWRIENPDLEIFNNGPEHEVNSYKNVANTYRNDERLVGVTSGSNNYSLAYDALGRCVKRTLNGAGGTAQTFARF
jgi:YD repeat-containing protein